MERILCGHSRAKQEKIAEYIRNQLREDHVADQRTLFEEVDPFTGEKIVRSIKSFFEKQ